MSSSTTITLPGSNLPFHIFDNNGGQTNLAGTQADLELAQKYSSSFDALFTDLQNNYANGVNIIFVQNRLSLERPFYSEADADGKTWDVFVSTNSSVQISNGDLGSGQPLRDTSFIEGVAHEMLHGVAPNELAGKRDLGSLEQDEQYVRQKNTAIEQELQNANQIKLSGVYDNNRQYDSLSNDYPTTFLSPGAGVVQNGSGLSVAPVGAQANPTHNYDQDSPEVEENYYNSADSLPLFTVFTATNPSGTSSTTSTTLYSANGGSQIGQLSASPDTNGDGYLYLQYNNSNENTSLDGTSIDAGEVTPNADGSFTFGSPQADPAGLVNQLNINGTFGTAGLSITDPTTGVTSTVPLDNGSSTTLQEGRSVATGAPNEQAVTTQSNGQVDDAIIGGGADVSLNNAALTFAPDTSASVTGTGDTLGLSADGSVSLVASGASLTVAGTGTIALDASGQTLNTSGGGDTISVASGATSDAIQADSATIYGSILSSSNVIGSNDAVTLSGASSLGILGDDDTVTATVGRDRRKEGIRTRQPSRAGARTTSWGRATTRRAAPRHSRWVCLQTVDSQLCVGVGKNCALKHIGPSSKA